MSETAEDPKPIIPVVGTPRVPVPLTPEQATGLLKVHHKFLTARVAKFEATESETRAATEVNAFVQSIPRPDAGAWEVNLVAGTLDPK